MDSSTTTFVSRRKRARVYGPPAALVLACGSIGFAGLINPGGDGYIWSGAVNDSWQVGGNWTGGSVPSDDDHVVVDNGPTNALLQAHSADLASLYVGGARAVSNNGYQLRVREGDGSTTVVGLDSRIFVTGVALNGIGFWTNELELDNDARLIMSGGRTRVDGQLTLMDDARIVGHGSVEIVSGNPAALNGLNGLSINATGGELALSVDGGGSLLFPPTVNVVDPGASLYVDAPLFAPADDMFMGEGAMIEFEQAWSIDGTLEAAPGVGQSASIAGAEMTVHGGIDVASGVLFMQAPVQFGTGSSSSVAGLGQMVIEGEHGAAPGSEIGVGFGSSLRFDGQLPPGPAFGADVSLSAGALEVNNPQPSVWRMSGDLTLGSIFGIRSSLDGDALMRLTAHVDLPGLGGVINNHTQLWPTATMDLAQASTRLIVNGVLSQLNGAHIYGDGQIEIAETGEMRVTEPVNLDVDVMNAGEFGVNADGALVGYAYIDGDYVQESTGRLVVEMQEFAPTERDVYETSGSATLSGELFVNLIAGYEPTIGDTFEVFFANSGLSGTFDSLAGDPGFAVSYPGNTVVLTYVGLNPCPADLNGDGHVGAADIAELLSFWGEAGNSDIDGDGDTNALDLAILLGFWGPCP